MSAASPSATPTTPGTDVGDGPESAPGCKWHKYGGQGPWNSFCSEGYIWSAESAPWALRDLTIYVTKFHHSVVHVSRSRGFRMANVRVRALAFFALSAREAAAEQLGGFHNRYAPYGFTDVGEARDLRDDVACVFVHRASLHSPFESESSFFSGSWVSTCCARRHQRRLVFLLFFA